MVPQENQIPGNQPAQTVAIDAQSFGAKFQSKREVYRFLTHDCGAYLASYDSMTIFHMKDLAAGKRKRIKQVEVKVITIPFFEGLKIEAMLEYAATKPQVMDCLPMVKRERERLPRQYLGNVIYTIIGEPFKQWVDSIVNSRHEVRRQPQDQIQMDPEIARLFNESSAVAGRYTIDRVHDFCGGIVNLYLTISSYTNQCSSSI